MDDLERELLEEKRLTIARLERELNEEVQTGLKYLGERNEKIKELAAMTAERDAFRGIFGEYDFTATVEQAQVLWNTLKQQLAAMTTARDEANSAAIIERADKLTAQARVAVLEKCFMRDQWSLAVQDAARLRARLAMLEEGA